MRCARRRAILHEAPRRPADRHVAHSRAGRGRGTAGRGRRRRGRHDTRADRRSRPAASPASRTARRSASSAPAATRAASATTTWACRSRACRTRARVARRALQEPAPQAGTSVLVAGGGPAGMAAAVAAARAGAEVTLVEAARRARRPVRAGRPRARAPRDCSVATPADWSAPAGGGRRATCAWARASTRSSPLAAAADRVIVATGAVAHRPPLTAAARRRDGRRLGCDPRARARVRARRSWPTGAAAGPAWTRPRRWPRPACRCGSPSPHRSWARPSTSTSASSTWRGSNGSA